MQISLILASLACFIFMAYNIVTIKIFGMPTSLSDTFYLYHGGYDGERTVTITIYYYV